MVLNYAAVLAAGSSAVVLLINQPGLAPGSLSAPSNAVCARYEVKAGDTLSEIADKAGLSGGYGDLLSANPDLMKDPDLIRAGMILDIPCAADAAVVPAVVNGSVDGDAPEIVPAQISTSGDDALAVLVHAGFSLFSHDTLPSGGLVAELFEEAMKASDPSHSYLFVFQNATEAELNATLPSGEFQLGLPWVMPDCSVAAKLSAEETAYCDAYLASDPFIEIDIGYFTIEGNAFAGADSHSDLLGARLCRAEGQTTFDLHAEHMIEPLVTLLRPATREECWARLVSGEVDIVTYEALAARSDVASADLPATVIELSELTRKQMLRAVAPRSNAYAEEHIATINAGLAQIRSEGIWAEVVMRHTGAHSAAVAPEN